MGNQVKESKTSQLYDNTIKFYSFSEHPILGNVPVYSILNEGKYVMKIKRYSQINHNKISLKKLSQNSPNSNKFQGNKVLGKTKTDNRQTIFRLIASENSQYLLKYYQRIPLSEQQKQTNKNMSTKTGFNSQDSESVTTDPLSNENKDTKKNRVYSLSQNFCTAVPILPDFPNFGDSLLREEYWEYLNHDLAAYTNKKSPLNQNITKQILVTAVRASQILKKYGLYHQFELRDIQFTAGMVPQIYWIDLELDNSHRCYYKYFLSTNKQNQQYKCYLLSPQELCLLKNKHKFNFMENSLDLQKCVVFTLGMIILQCLTGHSSIELYCFQTLQVRNKLKQQRIQSIKVGNNSKKWKKLLKSMLQPMLRRRSSYYRILEQLVNIQIVQNHQID